VLTKEKKSASGTRCGEQIKWPDPPDANLGILVAKLPTGDFPRESSEGIPNPFWARALHWSQKWWYEHEFDDVAIFTCQTNAVK
jgi:hypothetical protein